MRHSRYLPLVALLLCAGIPPTFADQVVYFVNGKAIMVKSVEKGEKFTILEMDGGGRIGVPTDQISKIEDFSISEPVPVPAPATPPQVVSAVVPALPARPASPSTPITPTSMTPGPGIGGRPVPGAAQSITGIRPIEIGESGVPAVGQRSMSRVGMANRGLGAPMMVPTGSGRANLAAGRRPGGRGGMGNARGAGRLAELNPGASPPAAQSAAQSGAVTPPGAPPVAPSPAIASEPEEPPPSPDDADEEPYDPSAPAEDNSSGSNPGGPS